jgi:CSLREA domain-containing protein
MLIDATMPSWHRLLPGLLALALASPVLSATFTVNSTADRPNLQINGSCDTGQLIGSLPECTLRAALEEANAQALAANIQFNIEDCPAARCLIEIDTDSSGNLPDLQRPIRIDGSTQPGNEHVCLQAIPERSAYQIILQGDGAGIGLRVAQGGDGSVIRGLNIRNFDNAIDLIGSNDNRVECNFIGSDESGMLAGPGNLAYGVLIACDSADNIIGGRDAADANLISANGIDGVKLFAGFTCNPDPADNVPTSNAVLGNLIGTAADGLSPLGNASHGIALFGGLGADGNFIGVLQDGSSVHGNVIAANGLAGIWLDSEPGAPKGTEGTVIVGNHIGTDRSGQAELGNQLSGIHIIRGAHSRIGGPAAADANQIAFNGQGIYITHDVSVGNRIQQNAMHGNTGSGIALVVHPEEPDGSGPNRLQAAPEIFSAIREGNAILVSYSVTASSEDLPLIVEFFFADADLDEGQTYLASHSYGVSGLVTTSFTVPSSAGGTWLLATASDPAGNTSEFSQAAELDIIDMIFQDRFQ